LGLSGVPFSGADVGGFGSSRGMLGAVKILRRKELFARWMQLGSLMPFFRAHTTLYSTCQEPWCFGQRILQISRKHMRRRYLLLPYIYLQFRHAAQTGEPPVRPLFYHNPKLLHQSSKYWQSQFFVGDDLLAAPVLQRHQRKRKVFLPEGEWYEFEYGTLFSGDEVHSINTPLEYYPLFVKAGTILPTGAIGRNSDDMHNEPINLEIYPGAELFGRLYLDDGLTSQADQEENYFLLEAKGKRKNSQLEIQLKILKKKYLPTVATIRIRVPQPYKKLSFRGKDIPGKPVDLTEEGRFLKMYQFEIPLNDGKVNISR
jgi:alpha-glucosidase